jgi:hypothetical protein
MKYQVKFTIINTFSVSAADKDEAEYIARGYLEEAVSEFSRRLFAGDDVDEIEITIDEQEEGDEKN